MVIPLLEDTFSSLIQATKRVSTKHNAEDPATPIQSERVRLVRLGRSLIN
jgi:hypothetical protein